MTLSTKVNCYQPRQTACPYPAKGETIGKLAIALPLMFREAVKSALEANPQTLQENRD